MKIIDLTHSLSDTIPTWDGSCGFELAIDTDYKDCALPDLFRTQKIKCGAGIGTHIDAPAHAIEGGRTIDKLNPEELVSDCVVIDVSYEADEKYVILPSIVEQFEKENGQIPINSFVIFYTGWSKYWEIKEKYHNNFMFPSVHEDTAKMLLGRGILGLGIDTLSTDTGKNGFSVHRAVLGDDKYLVENITNIEQLPKIGAKIFIMPIKVKGGTESPVRIFAIIN